MLASLWTATWIEVPRTWLLSREREEAKRRSAPLYVAIERTLAMRRFESRWVRIVDGCRRYGRLLQHLHVTPDGVRWMADEIRDDLVELGEALYREKLIRDRSESVEDVHRILAGLLSVWVTNGRLAVTFTNTRVKPHAGAPLGGRRERARKWKPDQLEVTFPALVDVLSKRYARPIERDRRPAWIEDLANLLNVTPMTVQQYLRENPKLQRCLDDARAKNKAISGKATGRA